MFSSLNLRLFLIISSLLSEIKFPILIIPLSADGITISEPNLYHYKYITIKDSNTALAEVKNLESWAANNRMSLNLSKTWEMLLRSRTTQPAPPPVPEIERKSG